MSVSKGLEFSGPALSIQHKEPFSLILHFKLYKTLIIVLIDICQLWLANMAHIGWVGELGGRV